MDLWQFECFLAVVDAGSIGKAARQLGLSQPTLTRHIRTLERALKVELFTRSQSGTTLNQFGKALERRARAIIIGAAHARQEIENIAAAQQGRVIVATVPSFANRILLPWVLPRFRAEHPNVQVMLIEAVAQDALSRVASGEIDLACGSVHPSFEPNGAIVCEIVIPREPILPVVGDDNPLGERRHVSLKELQPGPWALYDSHVVRTRLNEIFQAHNLPSPVPSVLFGTISFAKLMLRHGPYIALLTRGAVHEEIAEGKIHVVQAPELKLDRNVGVFRHAQLTLSPAAQALLDGIREGIAQQQNRRGLIDGRKSEISAEWSVNVGGSNARPAR